MRASYWNIGIKAFTDTTHAGHHLIPLQEPRSFNSFDEAAQEAVASRLYGGIHFPFDNDEGLSARVGVHRTQRLPGCLRGNFCCRDTWWRPEDDHHPGKRRGVFTIVEFQASSAGAEIGCLHILLPPSGVRAHPFVSLLGRVC
jgi:hypothetical protein